MSHVVFLLESNVDNGLGNGLADSIQELGFSNDDLQFWGEVHFIGDVICGLVDLFLQNKFVEELDGFISVFVLPLVEDLLLIVLIKIFSKSDVLMSYLAELLTHKLVRLALELLDWSLDSSHNGSSPSNRTSLWWHVLGNWRLISVLVEKILHDGKFFTISDKDGIILLVQKVLDCSSGLDVLELSQKIESTLR
jgi:hypothetical protein